MIPTDHYEKVAVGSVLDLTGYTCIDPDDANATINQYSAGSSVSEVTKSVQIGFEICQRAA